MMQRADGLIRLHRIIKMTPWGEYSFEKNDDREGDRPGENVVGGEEISKAVLLGMIGDVHKDLKMLLKKAEVAEAAVAEKKIQN